MCKLNWRRRGAKERYQPTSIPAGSMPNRYQVRRDSPRILANGSSSSGLDLFTIFVIASTYNIVPVCISSCACSKGYGLHSKNSTPPTCRVCCFRLEAAPRLRNPVKRFTRKVSPDATSGFFEFEASAETSRIFRLRGVRITAPL